MDLLERTRGCCANILASTALVRIAEAVRSTGSSGEECEAEANRISEPPATQARLRRIFEAASAADRDVPAGSFERYVLARATSRSIDRLDSIPVADAVKALWCNTLVRYLDPKMTVAFSQHRFIALCKVATFRRFPAGQFDWEPSGLPRSWLPRVRPLSALGAVVSLVAKWRGFGPAYFVHMTVSRPVYALVEREAEKSYYRMAQSMQLQPEIQGLIASSWLHSPDTFAVTPHLAWLNRVFLDNGAVVATMGAAPPDCGVFHRSPERQKAFAEGRFKPTLGLIIWPRREMLEWAARHPELTS